jgi:rod shape-determining protein MreD
MMADRIDSRTWMNRGIFVMLSFVIIVLQLVPLDLRPPSWTGPDLMLAVTLVWVARRPDYLPVYVIALLFLLTDLLFQRPPGLWAALVVILTETVRNRNREFHSMPFFAEWGTIAFGIVTISLANRLILAIVMTPQAPLALTAVQVITTILAYPLVVFVAHYLFGVTRLGTPETNTKRQRL